MSFQSNEYAMHTSTPIAGLNPPPRRWSVRKYLLLVLQACESDYEARDFFKHLLLVSQRLDIRTSFVYHHYAPHVHTVTCMG